MANCLWGLCTCPTAMPCPEHTGIWCSRFFGRPVLRLADAQDAAVTRALAMLRDLEREAEQTAVKVREAEARKQRWESRKGAFEQRYQNVDDSQAADLEADGRAITADATLEVAGAEGEVRDATQAAADPEGGAGFLAPLLHIPYHDPAAQCRCYQRKVRRLITVQDRINSAQADVLQRAQRLQAQIRQTWLVVAVASAAVAGVGGYVLWIGALAVKAAIIILFVVAIALLGQLIMLLLARRALTQARVRLLKARLLYYRLQHVSTCMLPFPGWDQTDPPGTPDGDEESSVEGYLDELDTELTGPGRG